MNTGVPARFDTETIGDEMPIWNAGGRGNKPKGNEDPLEGSRSFDGEIYHSPALDGEGLHANERHFLDAAVARTTSEWLSALRGLEGRRGIDVFRK